MNQIVPASAASAATIVPQSFAGVHAPLSFIRPQDTKPSFHSSALTGGEPKLLFDTEERTVPIADMRPFADSLSVDREGFALLQHRTEVADLYDDQAVKRAYYQEIKALLRREFGDSRIVIFDATRRSDGGAGAPNPDGRRGPASRVHVDYTAKSGPQRVKDFFGESEAARLLDGGNRLVQVNVWRPIRGPVQRSPLALADASTVRPEDLIATDQVFPDRVGEIYHLAYDPDQRWYYAPEMTPDEVLLIKGWDSDEDRAQFTPHSAFPLPGTTDATPPRESIEIRTLLALK